MRKFHASVPISLIFILSLAGCSAIGDKSGSLTYIYGAVAVLSLLLLVGCIALVRKKRTWFITLFSSVFVVNIGYTLLAVSSDLEMALCANRLSYLGSVFLPLSMLMILLNITNTPYQKRLPNILLIVSAVVFLIAASPGILPVYYAEVSFAVVNGVSTLNKVYGPLHPIYLVYLLGYFSAMVAVIIQANFKKAIDTAAHAIIIAIAVFVNIGVWLIEQLVSIDFEILSISYIITELFLLGVHLVMNEYQRMSHLVKQVETVQHYPEETAAALTAMLETPVVAEAISPEQIEYFMAGLQTLTPSEKQLFEAYIARVTTKEIMANMNIKESTVKYHSRNLYAKLGVANRKELLELHKQIKSVKAQLGETGTVADKSIESNS